MVAEGEGGQREGEQKLPKQKPIVSFITGEIVASIYWSKVLRALWMHPWGGLMSCKDDGLSLCATQMEET